MTTKTRTLLDAQLAEAGLAPMVSAQPLVFNPNNPVTDTVERLELSDGTVVVRKVLCRDGPTTVAHWPAGLEVAHWNYWRREAHAHLDGFVDRLSGDGLGVPSLLGHVVTTEGVESLFFEWVDGASGDDLAIDELARVAAGLGRAQGRLAVAPGAVPSGVSPWWSREWIWHYALSRPPGMAGYSVDEPWRHPVVIEGFGDSAAHIRARFGELRGELDLWRSIAAGLPTTVAHLDCWANNIVVPAEGDPHLFDWSFCGVGLVGEDPGNLVLDGLLDHYLDPGQYDAVDAAVWHAYLGGLEDSGWGGPPEAARLGMCMAVLKFVWLPALMVANAGWTGPTAYGGKDGLQLVEVFRRRAEVFESMLERIDEGRQLARGLGLLGP
ncbi:MAG: phosphotransferase [Actinomycetia bacterium]|nr:phosphotransferase [Actinomycetes bacterium]